MRTKSITIVTAILLCAFIGESHANESAFLQALAPPAIPEDLRSFSNLTLKPIGRVDMRLEQQGTIRTKSGGFDYSVTIEGYSIFSQDGSFIQRDDHILNIVFGASNGSAAGGTVTMKWQGARLAIHRYDIKGHLQSVSFKLGALPDPDTLDISPGAKISRNAALQQVGFLARFALQGMNSVRVPPPDAEISVGQALLPTNPLAAKVWLIDDLVLPFMRGSGDEPSPAKREELLNELPSPKWTNDARIRGVTRKDGFDYIDYGGYMEVTTDLGSSGEVFQGNVRCLIDPFSGIVRSAAADGRYRGIDDKGKPTELTMRTRFETAIEQKVAPPAPPPQTTPPKPSESTGIPTLPSSSNAPTSIISTADLYDQSLPSVVTIVAGQAQGSGFFIADGIVVTNAHVVDKENTVTVIGKDTRERAGTVILADQSLDIAFVRTAKGATPLLLANDLPRTGEQALVIGSPYGLEGTLTGGLVSSIRVIDGIKYVQTDAPINGGNSGGPVMDAAGRVIGMATWKLQNTKEGFEGLGFAIAATEIRKRFTNQQ